MFRHCYKISQRNSQPQEINCAFLYYLTRYDGCEISTQLVTTLQALQTFVSKDYSRAKCKVCKILSS